MQTFIGTLDEFSGFLAREQAVLVYFSTDECQVCKVLKPKIEELIDGSFAKMKLLYVPLNGNPEIAGQYRIFAVPTVVVYFEGREFVRKSRSFGLEELESEISRPYKLMFS